MTVAASDLNPGVKTEIVLKNVRLGVFPDLFAPRQFDGKGEFKYAAKFIMAAGSEEKKAVDAAIRAAAVKTYGAKADTFLKTVQGQKKEYCFIDGSVLGRPEYDGMWVLSAKRKEKDGAPNVYARDKSPLTAESGKVYPGCYVNAKVRLWAQDAPFPGMRCEFSGVQFVKDGEAFSGAGPANDVGFEELADDENDLL
jgi:hypothetical protein